MKKKYKVALNVDGICQVTYTLRAYTSDGAVYRAKVKAFDDFGESIFNSVYVEEIKENSFERYHILNIASAIREADEWYECENECTELCRLAGMESEWKEADGETFEAVLIEAAKKLGVEI